MPVKSFSSTLSQRGQCVIPSPLRKQLRLSGGEDLIFWINERGHLEAEPARQARARAYKNFNHEADALAESLSDSWCEHDAEEIVANQRR